MVDWHIVFDWHKNSAFGPFPSKTAAEDWLMGQDIPPDKYTENEVSIMPLCSITEKLEIVILLPAP